MRGKLEKYLVSPLFNAWNHPCVHSGEGTSNQTSYIYGNVTQHYSWRKQWLRGLKLTNSDWDGADVRRSDPLCRGPQWTWQIPRCSGQYPHRWRLHLNVETLQTEALSCDGEETWVHGNSLINYMKMVEMNGLSGKIRWGFIMLALVLIVVGKYDFGFIVYFLLVIKVLISLTQGLMALDSELISPWK